ncbi:MAG: hypothetical protein ABIY70_20555 [Capsulimonas sp.]|uniref:hypothetical protein n=1 Tax=Capsulimonas sp. TaxID=2494211 RepID=UPI00326322BE
MAERTPNTDEFRTSFARIESEPEQLPANTEALDSHESREAYNLLPEMTKDEWRRVHLVPRHGHLIQGGVYFDLRHPTRGEFVAPAPTTIHPDDMYVAQHDVDSEIWEKLQSKIHEWNV